METAREVVEKAFDELKALIGSGERLLISRSLDGQSLAVVLMDTCNGKWVASGLNHVIDVLTERIR